MKLNEKLSELNIKYTSYGNMEFEYLGLADAEINQLCTFIESDKYASNLGKNVSVIITNEDTYKNCMFENACVVDNPRITFFMLHNYLCDNDEYVRKPFKTVIGKNCKISELAYISPENVIIGDNVVIDEFVSIKKNTKIGSNTIIRTGVVVGGEGFEEKRTPNGTMSVLHEGGVIIGDNVDIHQNTCIDKAIYPWDNTLISDNCRIDILCHIAHAVHLAEGVFVAGCSAVAGRVRVGKNTWIGPQVIVRNGLNIGDNAKINMGAAVTRNVESGESVTGNFAIDHAKFMEHIKSISK